MSKPDPAVEAVNAEQAERQQAAQDFPLATAADLLAGKAVVQERTVPLPQWGFSIRLRAITMYEAEDLGQKSMEPDPDNPDRRRQNMALLNRLVTQKSLQVPRLTPEQVDELWGEEYGYVKDIVDEVMKINRMGPYAKADGGNAEAVKSVAAPEMDAA